MHEIKIPIKEETKIIKSDNNFVIVGANGSGKSRLGAWIEKNNSNKTILRISAQRVLSISDNIILKSEENAWNKIYYGNEELHDKGYKWGWGNDYNNNLVNDYDSVLSGIFARQNKENASYVMDCKDKENNNQVKSKVPLMITDKIIEIWSSVFPHRRILLEDVKIKAKDDSNNIYHAKNMSDGERVAIYLIGQCLLAPHNTIIIVDEPEIHLHKSIMFKLWNKIEEFCTDKIIVYITHDLEFAASRKESTKIWLKSYNGGNKWDIELLLPNSEIPDSLMFEVLGNRKPILFVEGEKGSYDNHLYSYIFDKYSVIPCHNCSNVILMTKAFNNKSIKSIHNYEVKGLIDHDYLTQEEINSYQKDNIYTLLVAEIENLYLLEELIKIIARNQALDPEDTFEKVKDFLFNEFNKEYDSQLISMCTKEIQHRLKCYTKPKKNNVDSLKQQLNSVVSSIKIEDIYNKRKNEVDDVLSKRDYEGLLRIYNRKSLHERVSGILKLSSKEYPNLILRLLKTEKKDEIITALKKFTPKID